MNISISSVPVFLDTTDSAAQLYQQWARTYHYGHRVLPAMAVTTLMLYVYTASKKKAANKPWTNLALAGVVTVAMVPFTWLFMARTNNDLFRLEAESRSATAATFDIGEAQVLVLFWSGLHMMRSLFPLMGAVIGMNTSRD